jgi:urate oxidase
MTGTTSSEAARGEIVLGQNNYGKSEIRLFKVNRDTDRHEIWDLDVRVALEGDFEAAHLKGDNTGLPATDTMRNTVYALAKDHLTGSIERFGLALVDHFLESAPTVERAGVEITPSSGVAASARRGCRATRAATGGWKPGSGTSTC